MIKFLSFLFTLCCFVCSCTLGGDKKLTSSAEVEVLVLQENDSTMWLKIKNVSGRDLFIPANYHAAFPKGGDTIHFEAFGNPEINRGHYYKYSDLFSEPFYTTKIIPGERIDSVITEEYEIAYNQFGVEEFNRFRKDSSYTLKQTFNIPCNATAASLAYFYVPYSSILKPGYTLQDFIKFNNEHGKHVQTNIYKMYR